MFKKENKKESCENTIRNRIKCGDVKMENGVVSINGKEIIGNSFIVKNGIITVFNNNDVVYTTKKTS